ncbi:MAG: diguanylate cyclase domain-containing protein [Acidimicrobiales bacterium]
MDVVRDGEAEESAFTSGLWIYRDGFAPGTETVRARVADALVERVGEVVSDVLAAIVEEGEDYEKVTPDARRVLDGLARVAGQGTLLLAGWIRTGVPPGEGDFRHHGIDDDGYLPTSVTGRVIRMVRSSLAYADTIKRILHREVARAGGSEAMFWALAAGADLGSRRTLLNTAGVYDQRALDTERALAHKEAQLEYQALHDPLTGLANRALLFDRLDQACERQHRHPDQGGLGVIFIDLDDFKLVNDEHGHTAGDVVLREQAHRLQASVRPEDTVARLGGDEFVVMCESVPDPAWADAMVRRISDGLTPPVEVEGRRMAVTASMGSAVAFPPHCEVEGLVRKADDAMYEAKRRAKHRRAAAGGGRHGAKGDRLSPPRPLARTGRRRGALPWSMPPDASCSTPTVM